MASKYWIKLYHEILDDPKMGRLSDRLFRRTIQLFLIAGDYEADGILPTIEDISWRLRMNSEELETDLADLASMGIVHKSDDRWIVTKFSARQTASSGTERWRQWQERQRKENYYQTLDQRKANETLSDKDKDKDKDKDSDGGIFSVYEQEIGPLTPTIADTIKEFEKDSSQAYIIEAIKIAAKNNKRNINYVRGILRKWQAEGKTEIPKTQKFVEWS